MNGDVDRRCMEKVKKLKAELTEWHKLANGDILLLTES